MNISNTVTLGQGVGPINTDAISAFGKKTKIPGLLPASTVGAPAVGTTPVNTAKTTPAVSQPFSSSVGSNSSTNVSGNYVAPSGPASQASLTPSPYVQQPDTTVRGLFPNVVSSLVSRGSTASPQYNQAYNDAQNYNTQLQQSLRNEANAEAQNRLNPIPIGDQTGREAVIQNQYLKQQEAIGAGFQGASTLLGAANAQQGLQQGALTSAAGLAQPQVAGYGQTVFNPVSGQYEGGGGLPNEVMDQYARMAANGQISAIPASITGNPVLNAQLNEAAKKINPNYNPIISAATGAVTGQQTQQINQYTSALQQAQNLQSQLSDLITTFGLNPNDINAANKGIQLIAKNTSSPQYKTLQNYINDVASVYSQVLTPTGGSQTDTTRSIAASMLDATASGQSILSTMKSLDQAAQAKIAGVSTTGNQGSQYGETSAGGYSFVQDSNGNWVPK